jgi:lipoprotein-anchoring transpeptidase ErfK/SrfK
VIYLLIILKGKYMQYLVRKLYYVGPLSLLLALLLVANPLFACGVGASSPTPQAKSFTHSPPMKYPQTGITIDYVHVRSQASVYGMLLATYPPGTRVAIYATVRGQALWHDKAVWDRISDPDSSPRYIYGALVSITSIQRPINNKPAKSAKTKITSPLPRGREVVISISLQWMFVYDKGERIYDAPVTTGQPALSTPTGIYHILAKLSPTTFYSPWPPGSPYWYPATHINYALEWKEGGFFLHDSWWRTLYGPGTNVYHYDPADGWVSGTHGCVTMPLNAAIWLYKWAQIGTTVRINQ